MTDTTIYRDRIVDDHLAELFSEFPAVMVTGPRAVGKTTIAAQLVDEIVYLDEPGSAASFRADPDAAIRRAGRASSSLMGSQTHSPQFLRAPVE